MFHIFEKMKISHKLYINGCSLTRWCSISKIIQNYYTAHSISVRDIELSQWKKNRKTLLFCYVTWSCNAICYGKFRIHLQQNSEETVGRSSKFRELRWWCPRTYSWLENSQSDVEGLFLESQRGQLVTQTKQVQNWVFWFSGAYLTKGIFKPLPKNGGFT